MAASTVVPPQSLRPDEVPLAEYRLVSRTAVAAAGLGLASAVVLVTPLLAVVPIAAIIISSIALRSIAASRGQLVGRVPAIMGLCLAAFFLGWGVSWSLARQTAIEGRARQALDGWIELLEDGKTQQATQFRLPPSTRIQSPEALAEHYEKNTEAAKDLQSFITSAGVKDIVNLGRAADVRFESIASAAREGLTDMLLLKYSTARSNAPGQRQNLWIHVTRRFDEGTKRYEWEIGAVSTIPPSGVAE